jgi:hypothetical protein
MHTMRTPWGDRSSNHPGVGAMPRRRACSEKKKARVREHIQGNLVRETILGYFWGGCF